MKIIKFQPIEYQTHPNSELIYFSLKASAICHKHRYSEADRLVTCYLLGKIITHIIAIRSIFVIILRVAQPQRRKGHEESQSFPFSPRRHYPLHAGNP